MFLGFIGVLIAGLALGAMWGYFVAEESDRRVKGLEKENKALRHINHNHGDRMQTLHRKLRECQGGA